MHEHCSVLCREVSAIVSDDLAIAYTDDIQAQRKVFGCHVVTDACSLQRSAAFVHLVLVVAKDGTVGNFGAREEPVGDCHQASCAAFACQHVHIRRVSILQERLATEALHGMVCHAIT